MSRAAALRSRIALAVLCAPAALLASGCGEAERDASEAKRTFQVEVLRARFPSRQAIARDTSLEIVVRNASARTIPHLSVTVDSLAYKSSYPGLADNLRPAWVVNHGPGPLAEPPPELESVNSAGAAQTAFVDTWSLGALPAGAQKAFVWNVTPVKPGTHTLRFRVAAGLDGRSRARLPDGGLPAGQLTVRVAPRPPSTHVNAETGAIAAGPTPTPAGPLPAVP